MKIKKGDKVQIIGGKDRVKRNRKGEKKDTANQGKVTKIIIAKNQVVVEGLNLRYKHVRPKREGEKGQRMEFAAPLHVSSVMLVCPKCSVPTRVGYKLLATDLKGGKKIRICRKCHEAID